MQKLFYVSCRNGDKTYYLYFITLELLKSVNSLIKLMEEK